MANTSREASILLIDTEGTARRSLSVILGKEKFQITLADSVETALKMLAADRYDFVLINSGSNQQSSLEVLKRIKRGCPYSETIVLRASYDGQFAVQAMQAGAFDCLSELSSHEHLLFRLNKAIEHGRIKRELIALRQEVAMTCGFDNLIGVSKEMSKLKESAQRIAPTDIPLLITGASGAGKSLLARVIHHHSSRRRGPFVSFDCSNIDEALLETELFGFSESARVSGQPTSPTFVERADSGTLFVDSVDHMPLSIQAGLAHFLQDFKLKPTGSTIEKKVDFRIIAASERDLRFLVTEGRFREDLYHRLSVVKLHIPRLVERVEDIEILTEYFLRKIAGEPTGKQCSISRQAVDKLVGHTWPGNVRELENTLRRAVAVARDNHLDSDDITFGDDITFSDDIPFGDDITVSDDITFIAGNLCNEGEASTPTDLTPRRTDGLLDKSQRSVIMKALADNDWNFSQTAQELGIGRTTLWRKVKKYNLRRETVSK